MDCLENSSLVLSMGSCLSTCDEVNHTLPRRRPLEKEALEALETEAKKDEQLACLPRRMCVNGSSDVASIYSQQGKKGVNQDCMVVWEDFGSREDTVFCGVFDGHGPYGHLVSRRVRDSLPSTLIDQWHELISEESSFPKGDLLEDPDKESESKLKDDSGSCKDEPQMFAIWKESHLRAFKFMDKELKLHPALDCFCSGTTAVTIVKQGQELVIANVGDSRAIMGTMTDDKRLMAVQLTVDLKPNLPKEEERISQCGGRVYALEDEPEVHRVWLPDDDSPGLAMARAFGDLCLKDFGVIAVPEVTYRRLTNRDQFIVLATDGVWDVLSNQEVVSIVSSAPSRATAAKVVVETAVRAWKRKFPTSRADDCAVVCLYVDSESFLSPLANVNSDDLTLKDVNVKEIQEVSDASRNNAECIATSTNNTDSEKLLDKESHDDKDARRSLGECIATDEWSALDGLTRANSLLSLPRFMMGYRKDDGSKRRRRRLC